MPDVNTDVCNSCQSHEICVSEDKIQFRCELRGKLMSHTPRDAVAQKIEVPWCPLFSLFLIFFSILLPTFLFLV